MAKKKDLTPHVEFLHEALTVLRDKTEEAKTYLSEVSWQTIKDVDDKEKEFKFQKTLVDSYVLWLNEYAKMSGILERLEELDVDVQKDVRKGSFRSKYADMIKNGELDD